MTTQGRVKVNPQVDSQHSRLQRRLFSQGETSALRALWPFMRTAPILPTPAAAWSVSIFRKQVSDKLARLIVFDYWVGDDTDASIVVDEDGMLYAAVFKRNARLERAEPKQNELGQLWVKPTSASAPEAVIRWFGTHLRSHRSSRNGGGSYDAGIWATPALYEGHLCPLTTARSILSMPARVEVVWQTTGSGISQLVLTA